MNMIAVMERQFEQTRSDIIGYHTSISTPLGQKSLVYADYAASARCLRSIENYIVEKAMPVYGNVHSVSTATARQMTYFLSESRQTIKQAFNCCYDDALIFTGNGATSAAATWISIMKKGKWTSGPRKSIYLEEDRWGSRVCTLCETRVDDENSFRRHELTEGHLARLRALDQSKKGDKNVKNGNFQKRVVFLLDPTLHHSSLLPFRELTVESNDGRTETAFEVLDVGLDTARGIICLTDLQKKLLKLKTTSDASNEKLLLVCVVNGVSNITGTSVFKGEIYVKLNQLVHFYEGIVCYDLASAAPHFNVDMNPTSRQNQRFGAGEGLAHIDVAFVSPHKMLGGPGTPGILLCKKKLLTNSVPSTPGGGAVFFVSVDGQEYLNAVEPREEAGSPNVLGIIRCGLVFQHAEKLAEQVGIEALQTKETSIVKYLLEAFATDSRIVVLGPNDPKQDLRFPVISFLITSDDSGKQKCNDKCLLTQGRTYLHHNFIVAILNDVFGIQARAGCSCAGPYVQHLLGLSPADVALYHQVIVSTGKEAYRPGAVRLSLNAVMKSSEVEFIAKAVLWVAERGVSLLQYYRIDMATAEWSAYQYKPEKTRVWLADLDSKRSFSQKVEEPACAFDDLVACIKDYELPPARLAKPHIEREDLMWFSLTAPSTPVRLNSPSTSKLIPVETETITGSPPTSKRSDDIKEDEPDEAEDNETDQHDDFLVQVKEKPKKKILLLTTKNHLHCNLRKLVGQATKEFGMFRQGDRVLLGLSGGKDSLTLFHILLYLKSMSPIKFELAVATVDPKAPEYKPKSLTAYVESFGVTHHLLELNILELAKEKVKRDTMCSFCARMKRGLLYGCMEENGYNVLALGQHLDDLCESLLMSMLYNGRMATMKASYETETSGNASVRIVRPLCYIREKETEEFAKAHNLPVIMENCPACFAAPKERHRMKLILSKEEYDHPFVINSLKQAMRPMLSAGKRQKHEDWLDVCGVDGSCENFCGSC